VFIKPREDKDSLPQNEKDNWFSYNDKIEEKKVYIRNELKDNYFLFCFLDCKRIIYEVKSPDNV
jgi:hypothetical protein